MISIHTNLSALVAQRNLKSSTDLLNQAIERMITGYKINQSKDNAANYSISNNMSTQISAYGIAEENVAMGIDLVTTASGTISQMQDNAARLQALSTQARNGTYGAQSLNAINSEANAIMEEMTRLYMTSEYNGISLFNRTTYTIASHLPQAGESGFVDETALIATASDTPTANAEYSNFIENPVTYTDEELEAMLVSGDIVVLDNNVTSFTNGQKYLITNKSELQRLATLVNSNIDSTGAIFILGSDIDLSGENWTPIGDYSTNSSYRFKGSFDGNGHVIKNLTIDNKTKNYQGLFGYTVSGSEIKNIGLVGGNVQGKNYIGSLVGGSYSTISNSYSTGDVSGSSTVGGLVGENSSSTISNSYATGDVSGTGTKVGGLVGWLTSSFKTISNSYATGNVSGSGNYVGGLVGHASFSKTISNSYATGNVSGSGSYIGGLVGFSTATISNSYANGDVSGTSLVGGLVGASSSSSSINNSYATGNVSGTSGYTGGLVGGTTTNSSLSISNSYATGNVSGTGDFVGGLVGTYSSSSSINNSYATGNVSGTTNVGGLAGFSSSSSSINNSYATGNVSGNRHVGGLIGQTSSSTISNSYATGDVSGATYLGGLVGTVYKTSGTTAISDSASYSIVSDADSNTTGSLIGGVINTSDGTTFATLDITGCKSISQDMNVIGGVYKYANSTHTLLSDYDMTTMLAGVSDVVINPILTTLQVGINGDNSCQLTFDTNFVFDISAIKVDIASDSALEQISDFINQLSEKQTQLGAVSNRLESVLDEITIKRENLVSSRSTLRDADIAEVSSTYIQQQILQQASATLLSTANQTPAIALQLL